jgi:hypothetical protein
MSTVETQVSTISAEERVSRKILAVYLILGSIGAIVMSWISYAAMIH